MPEPNLFEYRARERRAHKLARVILTAAVKTAESSQLNIWTEATKSAGLEREPSDETKKRTIELLRSMRPIASPEDWV